MARVDICTNHKVVLELRILVAEESCFRWGDVWQALTDSWDSLFKDLAYMEKANYQRKQGWITGRGSQALSGPSEKQLQSLYLLDSYQVADKMLRNVHLMWKTMSHSVVYLPIWFHSQCKCLVLRSREQVLLLLRRPVNSPHQPLLSETTNNLDCIWKCSSSSSYVLPSEHVCFDSSVTATVENG